jgi:hypothetical protein
VEISHVRNQHRPGPKDAARPRSDNQTELVSLLADPAQNASAAEHRVIGHKWWRPVAPEVYPLPACHLTITDPTGELDPVARLEGERKEQGHDAILGRQAVSTLD